MLMMYTYHKHYICKLHTLCLDVHYLVLHCRTTYADRGKRLRDSRFFPQTLEVKYCHSAFSVSLKFHYFLFIYKLCGKIVIDIEIEFVMTALNSLLVDY